MEGDDAKLRAATDYLIVKEKLDEIEVAVSDLIPTINAYLRKALTADPAARVELETKLREIEVVLGQRRRPARRIVQGNRQGAKIVSIDSNTGTLVINGGTEAGIGVGMRFRIERAGKKVGEAVVGGTRPLISGLLIQNLEDQQVPVETGDIAKVILNSDQTD